jgi:HD-like signal output (HDOD) protein
MAGLFIKPLPGVGREARLKTGLLFYLANPENRRVWEEKVEVNRPTWACEFAADAGAAREKLAQRHFDIFLMDDAGGEDETIEFLHEVMNRYPDTTRFLLIEPAPPQKAAFYLRAAHQCLPNGMGVSLLEEAVGRAGIFKLTPRNELLVQLVSQMESIPSMPMLHLELMTRAQEPEARVEEIAAIVEKDPGLSAKLLRIVNSAYYGLARELSTPLEAIAYLGLNSVVSLALALKAFAQFDPGRLNGLSLETVWRHCLDTGDLARKIAQLENAPASIASAAFMGGLLHDIGKLILADNFSSSYQQAVTMSFMESLPLWEAETRVFGASHSEVAGCLLGLWGLPMPILEAITYHHCPSKCPNKNWSPLTAVHLANRLAPVVNQPELDRSSLDFDWAYLDEVGVTPRFEALVQSLRKQN